MKFFQGKQPQANNIFFTFTFIFNIFCILFTLSTWFLLSPIFYCSFSWHVISYLLLFHAFYCFFIIFSIISSSVLFVNFMQFFFFFLVWLSVLTCLYCCIYFYLLFCFHCSIDETLCQAKSLFKFSLNKRWAALESFQVELPKWTGPAQLSLDYIPW